MARCSSSSPSFSRLRGCVEPGARRLVPHLLATQRGRRGRLEFLRAHGHARAAALASHADVGIEHEAAVKRATILITSAFAVFRRSIANGDAAQAGAVAVRAALTLARCVVANFAGWIGCAARGRATLKARPRCQVARARLLATDFDRFAARVEFERLNPERLQLSPTVELAVRRALQVGTSAGTVDVDTNVAKDRAIHLGPATLAP